MKRRDFLLAASGGAAVSASAGAAGAASLGPSGATPGQESGTTTSGGTNVTNGGTTTAGGTTAAGDGTTAAGNGTTTGGNATTTAGDADGGGGGTTHEVDMEGVEFLPAELTIAPGDTVAWTTTGSQEHTVTAYADEIPADAAYFASGDFDSEEAARQAYPPGGAVGPGETYSHTFETLGTYGYFCIPHETAEMVGTIEVVEGGGGDGGGGGGGELDPHDMGVPFQAHYVGIATVLMMMVSLVYTFFTVKYGASPHASSPGRRD